MSGKASKRHAPIPNSVSLQTHEFNELKALMNTLINPVVQQLTVLSETVATVLTIVDKKFSNEMDKKVSRNCDYNYTSLSTDVTMMASSVHKLSKNYETVKEQMSENQMHFTKLNAKLTNIERLLRSLVRIENGHKHDKMLERLLNVEQMLLMHDLKATSNRFVERLSCLRNVLQTSVCSSSQTNSLHPFQVSASVGLDSSMQLITLNNEQDYPKGSWLGDINSPSCRVRCPISDEDLIYVNSRCTTAEKMAVTLLDYIFTKDILAVSNLSGKSKLGKRQLDPLMIYGIKCHLMHHFQITDKQWDKIKHNMDSKCRSAWKKKKLEADCHSKLQLEEHSCMDVMPDCLESAGVMIEDLKGQVIHTLQGDIEVLQATPDQILRFHDLHNIHVLDGNNILPVLSADPDDSDGMDALVESDKAVHLPIIAAVESSTEGEGDWRF